MRREEEGGGIYFSSGRRLEGGTSCYFVWKKRIGEGKGMLGNVDRHRERIRSLEVEKKRQREEEAPVGRIAKEADLAW